MCVFLSGNDMNRPYQRACNEVTPSDTEWQEHLDFLNMYDGCAFE